MKKTILTLIAFITLLTSVTLIPANAAIADPGETVMPLWDNVTSTSTNFLFNDNLEGSAEITVTAKLGSTSTTITIKVYRQEGNEWILIKEGSKTSTMIVTAYNVLFPGEVGEYYKAEYTISVTRLGTTETITETRYVTCE